MYLVLILMCWVHCRIGSLEDIRKRAHTDTRVHCRIGSLEVSIIIKALSNYVHCRIGSLEDLMHCCFF